MAIKYAVIRAALSSDIGSPDTDFTQADFGTPKAAIVLVCGANSSSNPQDEWNHSIGFWDGMNMRCVGFQGEDNAGTQQYQTIQDHGFIANIQPVTPDATFTVANITDGVRVTMTVDNTSLAYYATVILFGGSDISASVGSLQCDKTSGNTASVSGMAFEPDVLLCATTWRGADEQSQYTGMRGAFGACVNDGSQTQRGIGFGGVEAATTVTNQRLETDSALARINNDALEQSLEVTSFEADGFTVTTRDGNTGAGQYIYYLALHLGGNDFWLGTLTTPTSTGSDANSTPGFQPLLGIWAGGTIDAIDTTEGGHSMCLSASDGTQDSGIAWRDEDNVGTSDTDSHSNERVVDIRSEANGSSVVAATLTSFDAGGRTLNYSAVNGSAYYGWELLLGTGAAAAGWSPWLLQPSQIIGGGLV